MQGDWSVTLTETPCTLSRSAEQPPDPVTPPVLAFRCLQGQRGKAVTERFYMKSFEVEEMCLEVFEYRCSQPCVLKVTVGVKGYCIDSRRSTLFFKCIDDVDDVVEEVRLARLHEGVSFVLFLMAEKKGYSVKTVLLNYYSIAGSFAPSLGMLSLIHI